MIKHDFLNLKIGDIEQYSMVVKKKDLPKWEKLGWLAFNRIVLPEGDEEAFMLYGDIEKDELLIFNRPQYLNQIGKDEILGLEIIDFSSHLGTYGMGGAGFFGLELSNGEYLVYAVWNAGNYVMVDDRIVECNPEFYSKTKPWISGFGKGEMWNHLTEYISGAKIEDYSIDEHSCEIAVNKLGKTITIKFVKNDGRLPRKVGRKRNAYNKGRIEDYLIFQNVKGRLIV